MDNPIPFSDEDWSRLERDWTAWWNHELDRPMLVAAGTVLAGRPAPAWWKGCGETGKLAHDIPAEAVAEEIWNDIRRIPLAGDAWPRFWINFGPGIAAAFVGGDAHPTKDSMWFYPGIWKDKPLREIRPAYDADNRWWRRVRDLTRACAAVFDGCAQVGFTDIGGGLDIAASLRETQPLLLDCMDDPDGVGELCRLITPLWLRYYEELAAEIVPAGRGTSAWTPLWSPGRTCTMQCDFSYMIGPDQFAEWVVPDLAACCARLDHGFYHLDGKGQIPHLDHLLDIPGLKGVQWIPGDGQPHAADPAWWPLLKRIRDAGKLVQIYSPADAVLRMAREVPLTGITIETWTPDRRNQAELVEAIQRENAAVRSRERPSI
ncbi:MAG: hypothetical protein WC003_08705 [Terrimicrobiaceae bacterium]